MALAQVKEKILELQSKLNAENDYELITNIVTRIKSPESIIEKMNRKGYKLTYKYLIDNINDIAGLRIICISEQAVYKIIKEISKIEEINILKKKDYIRKPKKSGYSAYHMIIEIPVNIGEKNIWVKVEIQVRTITMDFWANVEHRLRYKANTKVTKKNCSKLKIYAKILSLINKKMIKMYT